jgi:hypothetical protein
MVVERKMWRVVRWIVEECVFSAATGFCHVPWYIAIMSGGNWTYHVRIRPRLS